MKFILLNLFFVSNLAQAAGPSAAQFMSGASCQLSSFQSNLKDCEEVVKKSLTADIGKFCNDTAWSAVGLNSEDGTLNKSIDEKKQLASRNEIMSGPPWQNSLVPHMGYRGQIFAKCAKQAKDFGVSFCETVSDMRGNIDARHSKDPSAKTDSVHQLNESTSPDFNASLASNSVVRSVICTDVTILKAGDCGEALGKIVTYSKPNYMNVTAIPSYIKVFTEKKFIAGGKRAAKLILDRFEKNSVESGANLYDDIFNSYRVEGLSPKDAEDAAWEILAVVASSGPNVASRLSSFSVSPNFVGLKYAISAIAMSIPKLDMMSTASGHPYSMPSSVSTTCDIGKPYHFWMTAYLARKMTFDNHSPVGAASAAYLAQKGYEIMSTTSGRDPNRAFTSDSFGYWNNVIRIDTAFSSAAAIFGANSAQSYSQPIDIDEGLKRIVMAGSIQPKLSETEATGLWQEQWGRKGYNLWQKIIASDSGFNYQLERLKK